MNAREVTKNATDAIVDSKILKLVGPIAISLILAVLLWAGRMIIELDKSVLSQGQKIEWMAESFDELKEELREETRDRYTSDDARADWSQQHGLDALQNLRIDQSVRRIDALENPTGTHRR